MSVRPRSRLDEAYRATMYFVDGRCGRFALRIGCASAEIDALTAAHEVDAYTYITAYNPGSVAAPKELNEHRQHNLIKSIVESGYPFYSGEGKGDGDWPAEPSLLVLGVSEAEAAALARRFGQAAVLFGERGGPVRLLWANEENMRHA